MGEAAVDYVIRGREESTEQARTRLWDRLDNLLTSTAVETSQLAQLEVGLAIHHAEILDIRALINSNRIDQRIVELLDNRVKGPVSELVNECVQKLQALRDYEKIIDGKLRLLDEKLDEFSDLWNNRG